MSWSVYLLVFLVMVVGSTLQASVGMGQGLVIAPLLRLIEPNMLPGPVVVAGLLTSLVVVRRNSTRGDVREVLPALGGRVVGNGAAIALLFLLSDRGLTIAVAVMVLAFVAARLVDVRVPRTGGTMVVTGAVSGVSGTIAALGGAPMGLLYQQDTEARDFRGPMGIFTAVGSGLSLVLLTAFGEMDRESWLLAAALLPPMATGWLLARWVTPIVDRGYLRPIILALASGSALVLLASELL